MDANEIIKKFSPISTWSRIMAPGSILADNDLISNSGKAELRQLCFINVGAMIGSETMIDMGAVLGGRAIVGKRCHIGANAVLAGVIEPPSAQRRKLTYSYNFIIIDAVPLSWLFYFVMIDLVFSHLTKDSGDETGLQTFALCEL